MTTEEQAATDLERLQLLLQGDEHDLRAAIELLDVHPADQSDLYEALGSEDRQKMLALLSAEGVAALLEHLDEELLRELVDDMPRATLARVLDQTDNDVAADILRMLPPAEAARTLSQMNTAPEVTPLLRHEDESAGGLMTRGYITLHPDMTASEAVAFLRATRPLASEAYYLYVLDARNHLQGVVNLRQLIIADPETHLQDIMETDVISVTEDTDQEEVANLMQHYRVRSLPVVDADGVLRGVITGDDIIDVIQEEATEDMYIMAGLPGQDSLYASVGVSARRRIPWLIVNLVTAFFAGAIVALFEGTIADAAALAVFMPVIAGQGGNAGIQTVTIVVRGIALGELEPGDGWRVLRKELALGVIRGVFFGVLVGAVALLWQGEWAWGAVVGGAMMANMIIAGLLGTLIPVTLRQLKLDPALGSGVFLTAFTDMLGFLFLLGLGTIALSELR
ncbi:MAG TPA: magnesium transporter [Dehalococcoidia bacterium]|nr:magnesium transporter [Dehalococcoidia bacterium]